MSSGITSFFSSFISSAHADTEESNSAEAPPAQEEEEKTEPEEEKPEPEEEEEEEPEDVNTILLLYCDSCSYIIILLKEHPVIRDECKHSSECAALTKHFEHCQEKVHAGHGFKGEDCVEELYVFIVTTFSFL